MFIISILLLLFQFKKDILSYRLGSYTYKCYHKQCTHYHALGFPAYMIGSIAIGIIILVPLLTIMWVPLLMKEFYQFLSEFRILILIIFLPWTIQKISNRLYNRFSFAKGFIKSRM
jgi:hypothetical protein